jgi:hypothetical protein
MNDFFSWKRLGLLLRKDLMEEEKRYALLWLTTLGLITIFLIPLSMDFYERLARNERVDPNRDLFLTKYLMFLFVTLGTLFASMFMQPMNSETKRGAWLMCPASTMEKFLSRWLVVTPGYVAAFVTAAWAADGVRAAICRAVFPQLEASFPNMAELIPAKDGRSSDGFPEVLYIGLSGYFLLQSVFMLGATFWEKGSFFKTFTAVAVIITVFFTLCYWCVELFYDGSMEGVENVFNSFEPPHGGTKKDWQMVTRIVCTTLWTFTLTNWTLTFFRLRESEIVKRL